MIERRIVHLHIIIVVVALLLGILIGRSTNTEPKTSQQSVSDLEGAIPTRSPEKISPVATEDQQRPSSTTSVAADEAPTGKLQTTPRPQTAASPASAEKHLEASIERQDFEAIWQLAFDLIATGHYEEVDRLYEKFADAFHGGKLDSPLWKTPDFYSGNLMREYADNEISVLSYLGHLAQLQQPGELLADLRLELLEGEAAPLLLGFHEGRNPEIVAGWLPYYQDRIENWSGTSFRNREIILALGHIPVEESALLLMEVFPWTGSSQRLDVVRALARNGTAPAIETLMTIAKDDPNPVLRRAAAEAIELLR